MKITNIFNLPETFVKAVKNDPYTPGSCDISVTRLISPPRKVALEAKHYKEISEDVTDRIWALFGQAVHVVLERAEQKADTETRLSIDRQGWKISGQLDQFDPFSGVLIDYKVSSCYALKNGHRSEWDQQLNLLAAILRENGYAVTKLQIIVILRDWSRSMSFRDISYPAQPVAVIDIPIWSDERCEEFIDERIRLHQMARDSLPMCSPEERWQTPDVFALKKYNRKTAVKLYDIADEAEEACKAAGDNHYIEHRKGKSIRCESYCPVSGFCDQFGEELINNEKK